MKKVIIGSLVGTVIFFIYQSAMWMGGIHGYLGAYSPANREILEVLDQNLEEDGLYVLPDVEHSPDYMEAHHAIMQSWTGKPWAMVFFHKSMIDMSGKYVSLGAFYSLIACFMASLILYKGAFSSFWTRFLISMALAVFTLSQGVLDEMNWWSYPWSFVKPQVVDLTLGWAICSVWLAWYVKKD